MSAVADTAGVSRKTVSLVADGSRERIWRSVEQRILAVRVEDSVMVPISRAREAVDAQRASGMSTREISEAMGWNPKTGVGWVYRPDRRWVSRATVDRLRDVLDRQPDPVAHLLVQGDLLGRGDQRWRRRAACRGEDPEVFFAPDLEGPPHGRYLAERDRRWRDAKAVCRRCPVRADCLDAALASGEVGVWGGTTDEERRRLTTVRSA